MLVKVKGLYVKPRLKIHQFTDEPVTGKPVEGKRWYDRRPKHLSTLGDAMWPEAVKEDIAQQFIRIGVEDPYRQKLVEPFAIEFGGENDDGAYKLENVNWELCMDYFRWEASAWDRDTDEKDKAHKALVAEIRAKYGRMFNHHNTYSDGEGL